MLDTLKHLGIVMCCVIAISKTFIHGLTKYILSANATEVYTAEHDQQRRMDLRMRRRQNEENPLTMPNI